MSALLPHISHRRIETPPLCLIALTGEHDLSTTLDVERILTKAVAGGEPVVIDLQYATFVDSSILCLIIRAADQARRRGLAVVLPSDGEVARLFDLVDASATLMAFPTLQRAIAWCYPLTIGDEADWG